MIDIREMTPSDLDAALALRQQWLAALSSGCRDASLERDWFAAYPGNSNAFALVATAADKPVGYLLCSWHEHPTMSGTSAEIDEIHVSEDRRRRGIGRNLVARARRLLLDRVPDLTAIRSFAGMDDEVTQKFWQSVGHEQHVVEYTHYLE